MVARPTVRPLMPSKRPVLIALLCALSGCAQCPDPFAPPGTPVTRLHFPTGLAVHPTEPILFVANSNSDSEFSNGAVLAANLGWLVAQLELQDKVTEPVQDPWQTAIRVPSMGGPILLTPDGRHLFHITRQDARLIQLDIETEQDGVTMNCGPSEDSLPLCADGDHVLQLNLVDPYGMALQRVDNHYRLHVGSVRQSHIVGVDFLPQRPGVDRMFQVYDKNLGDTNRGGTLAVLPSLGGQAEYLFSTGRDFPGSNLQLGTARHYNLWQDINSTTVFSLDFFEQVGSVDVRGVAISKDGTRGYFISKIPAAVLEVDLRRLPDGRPRGEVLRVTPLGKEPSVAALYEPPNGPRLLLTASFRDDLVLAVDLDTFEVVGALRDVGKGPFDIAVDARRALAYVSCFNDDTIAVVRLPRVDDNRFFLAARLGVPRDDASTNPELPSFLPSLNIPGN